MDDDKFKAYFGEDARDTSKLLPELQMYVYDNDLWGVCLNAPLVQQFPFISWKMANESFTLKTEKVAEAIAAREWGQVLMWYERPFRITMLDLYRKQMTHDEYRDAVQYVWTDTELPGRNHGVPSLVRMFKRSGFLTDLDIVDYEALPPTMTVYRGVPNARHKKGISWTRSIEKAAWFANRFKQGGKVYETVIDKKEMLAYFEGRGESEVVLDPKNRLIQEVR